MNVEQLGLPEVLLLKPRVFRDDRGQFLETWRESMDKELAIGPFVQDNVSVSRRGVVRGIHFQHPNGQGKLVSALYGRVFDVAVDLRVDSPAFGRWVSAELSHENGWQLYIPAGFGHGFQALTDEVVFGYKCTAYYSPESERTLRWDDPLVGVSWPIAAATVTAKDAAASTLDRLRDGPLPRRNSSL